MAFGAASIRVVRRAEPRPAERLALLELLLGTEDPTEIADRCLEWLGEHAGVREAHCFVVDADHARLARLTGYGVGRATLDGFAVELEAQHHPLIRALSAAQPLILRGDDPALGPMASRRGPFMGLALHGVEAAQHIPAGLLLVRPVYGNNRELRWVVEYFGYRLGRVRTIAALAETEQRLRRERDLLQSILDRVIDPIILTDSEGRMVIANARAERLLATREDESEGRRRAVAINNMFFSSALGQRALEPGSSAPREVLLVDPAEGTDLLFELMSTTAGDARMGMGIVSILRNVSDLRKATEELEANYHRLRLADTDARAERDRLDLIIDSVVDPILVTDPSGTPVMMNAPAERLFAVSPDASGIEAQRVRANDANFSSFVSNLLFQAGESRHRGGINLVDPTTGRPIPVEAVSGKVSGEPAEVWAIVTILHDRTEAIEREQLYEQLKAASAQLELRVQEATATLVHQNELLRRQAIELEQASAAKSQFLASVSHEVRTPLNAILGYTSLLLKGVTGEVDTRQREALGRVEANARHLLTLINDILDIARVEAGKMPVQLGRFSLGELIGEIMTEVEPLVVRSKLLVTTEVPARLPGIRSDRQKVKQILLNLLTNALKFTPQGSVTVSCRSLPATREVAIAVADTGIGIAAGDAARIFEAFTQAGVPARQQGGIGLGLAICRRLAEVLGGRITLASKLRRGSTFTLTLPVTPRRP